LDKEKKKWRGKVARSGHKKQQLFQLKAEAKEWEINQKALPLDKFFGVENREFPDKASPKRPPRFTTPRSGPYM
jgi:hypothetical protein